MRYISGLSLWAACIILFPLMADPAHAGDPVDVFLLAGQSNMAGRAPTSGLPVELQSPQDDVLFYYGSTLTTLRPGSGTDFGPEVTFGRTVADEFPATSYALIKYATGGTDLYSDWNPSGGPNYTAFRSTVTNGLSALTSAGYEPNIVGMLWTQGERDAKAGRTTAQYEADLNNFIADMRTNYGNEMPFLLSRLSSGQTNIPAASLTNIRTAQGNVVIADPLSYLIDTDTFGLQGDNLHFDAPGQISLGQAFGQMYIDPQPFDPNPDPDPDPVSAGVIAHYSFDADFTDSSDSNNHLTVAVGTPTISTTAGEYVFGDGALDIDSTISTQEYLKLTNTITFASTDAWSVSFWARRRPGTDYRSGMVIGDPSNSTDFIWVPDNPSQVEGLRFRSSSNTNADFDGFPDDSQFHHWVVVSDGEGSVTTYRDNVALPTVATASPYNITSVGSAYNATTQSMDGQIDELYIFDGAISATVVDMLFSSNTVPGLIEPDLNQDGFIDGEDLNLLLSNYDALGIGGGNPSYNKNDLAVVLENFGSTNSSSQVDVPEPTSLVLLLLGLGGLMIVLRR